MRLLTLLAAAGLVASAFLASGHFRDRPGDLADSVFAEAPRERAERGEREQRLGVELAEDAQIQLPYEPRSFETRLNVDGSVMDQ